MSVDAFAISIVEIWNSLCLSLEAYSLQMGETSGNGYMLMFFAFCLLSGGGFFAFFEFDG